MGHSANNDIRSTRKRTQSLNSPLPDPILDALLSHLSAEKDFVFLETSKTTPEESRSLLFTKPLALLSLTAEQNVQAFLDAAQGYLHQG